MPTALSRYGDRPRPDRFPQVVFVGAATLSGQSRTPPGRRAVSFTMSSDYVGPDVGWFRTSTLETTCRPALRRDVTVQAAVTLAYEELGVRITLRDPAALVPGSGEPMEPTEVPERLNARLSKSAVARADIEYPEPFSTCADEPPSAKGTLVVAKALLTRDLPYELLTYALKETAFPRQSTGDQFFDHEQFDAYRALGFHLGAAAAEELTKSGWTVTGGRSSRR